MSMIHAAASAVIEAPPSQVYPIFTDYHESHPAILPRPYFTDLVVEQGGHGAGTEIMVRMRVFGVTREFHMVVSEPEPGRVLVERDDEAGVITTFTVDPVNNGQQSHVTIATDSRPMPGLQGVVEQLFSPFISRRIYREELAKLAEYVRERTAAQD